MPIIQIAFAGLTALFLSIPILNRVVFHTVDIEAIAVRGYDGLRKVQELQRDGRFEEARDSAHALVQEFRNDSTMFFVGDVYDWNAFLEQVKSENKPPAWTLIAEYLDEGFQDSLAAVDKADAMSSAQKERIVEILNRMANDPEFYIENREYIAVNEDEKVSELFQNSVDRGIFRRENGMVTVTEDLTPERQRLLKRFHMVALERFLCSDFLRKDLKRGTDWASEYIVQTALYLIGSSYSLQFQLDRSIRFLDSLVTLYPRTIYAEQIFLSNGGSLLSDGKAKLTAGQKEAAEGSLRRAIDYLEKIERNREIASSFPKYRVAELYPDRYVNIDEASKAKRRVKKKTKVYTSEQAKEDIEGRDDEEGSGYVLEDAVRLIGECYIQLGLTDSARAQFRLILEFFPESENLDDAQKLIADTYVKDGDLILAAADSGDARARRKAFEAYEAGVKEYIKFFNVFPQSDLVPQTYIALADAYNKLERPEDARSAFDAALAKAKDTEEQAKIQLEIGNYFYERERYAEAIEAYQIILNSFSSTQVAPNAQYLIGESQMGRGDTADALKAFRVIVDHYKRSNFFGGAAHKLGSHYFEQGTYTRADTFFALVVQYAESNELAPVSQLKRGEVRWQLSLSQEGDGKVAALKDAVKEYEKVIDKWPQSRQADQARVKVAECHMELGNERAAREVARSIQNREYIVKASKVFLQGEETNCEGELKYWQGLIDDAVEDEERASAVYEKAEVFLNRCEPADSALALYRQVLSLTDDRMKIINAKIGMARAFTALDKFSAAQDTLLVLIDHKRVSPELRQQLQVMLYDAYLRGGNPDKAYEGFEEFAAKYPEHKRAPQAYYRMGSILADRNEHRKAIEKFRVITDKYAESDSGMVDKAILGIGTRMIELGRTQEAAAYLKEYIEQYPEVSVASRIWLKIADTYWKHLGKKKDALEIYNDLVEKYPDDMLFSYMSYQRGMLLVELGRKEEAVAAFEKVEAENKSIFRAAQAEIGKLLAKKDPDAAIGHYQLIVNASETQGDSAIAMIGIGDVYAAVKKWDKAAEWFGKVYSFYDGGDSTLLGGALVKWVGALISGKNYQKAIEVADIMEERFPDNVYTANTMYYKATAYFSTNRFTKAREVFRRIIELDRSEQLTEIATYQKAECYYFMAANTKNNDAKNRLFRSAIAGYGTYLESYPQGTYS
ncbi:MAG: tetratricopeptide repeat protein, partial [Chitinivibrionales bacterium]|nr:tetratricopeptide repeat protein [Chitinivibrionales bacterium]MBD3357557.1 tetratricopeptide repeat protein [Chitinivibrionales bacterium]